MRTSKFSESQIVGILKEAEDGIAVPELQRKHGISKATFSSGEASTAAHPCPT
jgi:putative transposase